VRRRSPQLFPALTYRFWFDVFRSCVGASLLCSLLREKWNLLLVVHEKCPPPTPLVLIEFPVLSGSMLARSGVAVLTNLLFPPRG